MNNDLNDTQKLHMLVGSLRMLAANNPELKDRIDYLLKIVGFGKRTRGKKQKSATTGFVPFDDGVIDVPADEIK